MHASLCDPATAFMKGVHPHRSRALTSTSGHICLISLIVGTRPHCAAWCIAVHPIPSGAIGLHPRRSSSSKRSFSPRAAASRMSSPYWIGCAYAHDTSVMTSSKICAGPVRERHNYWNGYGVVKTSARHRNFIRFLRRNSSVYWSTSTAFRRLLLDNKAGITYKNQFSI